MDSILQTADRALEILELLSRESMTASEIQKEMGLNKSTVHRLLITLRSRGFVERIEATGIYGIGLKLVEISSIRLNHIELKTEALPYLHQLANRLNQSVQLAILDEREAVFIEKVEKYQSFHMYCQIGKRIPLYCSGVGKSLLLDKEEKEVREMLSKVVFRRFTDNTHQTVEALLTDLEASRKLGYTKDCGEHEEDVHCVAMPVYDYRGKIVAAVSVTGFTEKVFDEEGQEARKALKTTCDNISGRLGYTGYEGSSSTTESQSQQPLQ